MRNLSAKTVRTWYRIHKWSSLLCTAFLLISCLSGLPLVFREEISARFNPPRYAQLSATTPPVSLDRLVAEARRLYPNQIATSVSINGNYTQVSVSLAPSWAVLADNPQSARSIHFDAHTGEVLQQSEPFAGQRQAFLGVVLRLHRTLFADLPGELFMGTMALSFVVSLISGTLVYGPFMRRLSFGTYRRNTVPRIRWFDLHNLVGIVTLSWALMIGATGIMNELSTPLFGIWQRTDLRAILAPWKGKKPPEQGELSSVQAAFETTSHAFPDMVATSLTFPGGPLVGQYHYLVFLRGHTPLASRLLTPVLIDARSGKITAMVQLPWYLRALEISHPLHFGDSARLPLKIIWALFDIALIFMLGSGVYLWLSRRKTPVEKELDRLVSLEEQHVGVLAR